MKTTCSIIFLSWKRQENINEILQTYSKYDCIDEIIVWNNNRLFFISDLGLPKVKTINTSHDFGLNTRFIGALSAKNRCIILHDDDLILSERNISGLINCFERDYTRLYAYEGRKYLNNKYNRDQIGRVENVTKPTEADMTLTRCCCFDRLYAVEYCKLSDVIFYDIDLNLNGEDIVLSHIISNASGHKPLVVPIPDIDGYKELPAEYSEKLSTKANFIQVRNDLIDRCSILLPKPDYCDKDTNIITLFGNGFYPIGTYKDSFSVNSKYKLAIIKNDMNGTKYLSHEINPLKDWSVLYIEIDDCTIEPSDNFVICSLFKNSVTRVDFELIYEQDEINITKRTRIRSVEDFVSCEKISVSDLIKNGKKARLKNVKFILHHQSQASEFCITSLHIEKTSIDKCYHV